jgi:hypothetical protein
MPRFLQRLFARSTVWLNHKPEPIPFPLERRMATLSVVARARGRGSDLAAAELRGMQTVILAQRSIGWRGEAVRR